MEIQIEKKTPPSCLPVFINFTSFLSERLPEKVELMVKKVIEGRLLIKKEQDMIYHTIMVDNDTYQK